LGKVIRMRKGVSQASMMRGLPEVVIVGAGVVGCSVAYYLAKAGVEKVVVLEKGLVGCEASGEAAGMLAPQCEAEGPGPFLDFCLQGRAAFELLAEELKEITGINIEYLQRGLLYLIDDGEAEHRYTWQKQRGLRVEKLSLKEVFKLEPVLKKDLQGALYFPDDHHVHSGKLVKALAQAAMALGVRIREGCPAIGFLTDGGRVIGVKTPDGGIAAGSVVVCTGCWSKELLATLNWPIPVEPAKGQLISLKLSLPSLQHVIYTKEGYLVPRVSGELIIGSTVEFVGFDKQVTVAGVRKLVGFAMDLVPSLAEQPFLRAWAGLRPYSPDALPLIGPIPGHQGVLVATGHFRNGIVLGPITGQLIKALLLKEPPSLPLDPFDPARFRM